MRAQVALPDGPNYRKGQFVAGLRAAGFTIMDRIGVPAPGDVLLIWNRSPSKELEARRFEAFGARVLVAENGYLGKEWRGLKWFALAWGHHAGAGQWPQGGPERWDSWGVGLAPWKDDGGETLVLAQRGIGERGIASPPNWAQAVAKRIGGRVRPHPGTETPVVPFDKDLENASEVVTWHSAAALIALTKGYPVWYDFPRWIGAGACRALSAFHVEFARYDDEARLAMFRRLAWAMWTDAEVESGEAFRRLINECP